VHQRLHDHRALTFIDVIAGFSISVATARRDISVSDRL